MAELVSVNLQIGARRTLVSVRRVTAQTPLHMLNAAFIRLVMGKMESMVTAKLRVAPAMVNMLGVYL